MDFEWRTTDLSLENMNGNCKMGTKSQVRLQGGGGHGCFKTRFVFKVGFFVVPHTSDFGLLYFAKWYFAKRNETK